MQAEKNWLKLVSGDEYPLKNPRYGLRTINKKSGRTTAIIVADFNNFTIDDVKDFEMLTKTMLSTMTRIMSERENG